MKGETLKKKAVKAVKKNGPVYSILLWLSAAHFLNDALQMVIPAIYPLLKTDFNLNFTEIGIITLVYQLTASLLQPLVGLYTDKRPQPFSLTVGMGFTLMGLLCLAYSPSFMAVLFSVSLVGVGSSVFHPESSRMARYVSGGKAGMAQSIFQVGGNAGTAIGPLLAAAIIVPYGKTKIVFLTILALIAIIILWKVGTWFKKQEFHKNKPTNIGMDGILRLPRKKVIGAMSILMILIFSKFFYMAALKNYLTFYMMDRFDVSVQASQVHLFIFLFAVAAGTLIGGPLGDRYGRKRIIWFSILGTAPFALLIPFVNLVWTIVFIILVGVILSSAFPAIIVYAQELVPEKIGMVSGLFFGFAFGMGAVGAGILGLLADKTSIYFMFQVSAFLPLLGLFAGFLPRIEGFDNSADR